MKKRPKNNIFWPILLLAGFMPVAGPAQQMDVPVRIQAAMYTKIFKFIPQLRDRERVRLLIVSQNPAAADANSLIKAFDGTDTQVETCTPSRLASRIQVSDVVYFMPKTEAYSSECKKYKKLSITGIKRFTREGRVSIALGLISDKPRLFISIASLKAENYTISAEILRIAQLY